MAMFMHKSVQQAADRHADGQPGRPQYSVLRRVAINSTTEQVWEVANYNAAPGQPISEHVVFRKVNGQITYAGPAL